MIATKQIRKHVVVLNEFRQGRFRGSYYAYDYPTEEDARADVKSHNDKLPLAEPPYYSFPDEYTWAEYREEMDEEEFKRINNDLT